jgi:hypothetical protein
MIPYNSRSLNQEQLQRIVDLYETPRPNGSYRKQSEIGAKFGVSGDTISRILQAAGVDGTKRKGMNKRKLSKEDIDEIVRIYTTPADDGTWVGGETIAKQFGVTGGTIRRQLENRGIEIRSLAESHAHGKACRPARRGKSLPPEDESPPLCKCGCGQRVEWDSSRYCWYKYVKGHYRPKRPYHRKEWLRQEYCDKKRATTDIARQFGVSPTTITRIMEEYGIDRRSQAESLRLSGAVTGPNNGSWKGGVTDWDYSFNWKTLCKLVKDRDEWTCQLCGEQRKRWGHDLHIHHIDEDKENNHPHNLIALCKDCHQPLHGDVKIRKKLREIAERRTRDVSRYTW